MSGGNKNSPKIPMYFVGLHYILCHGTLDSIQQILVAEKPLLSLPLTVLTFIDKRELFGGLKREGGIAGNFEPLFGLPTQGYSGYLQQVLGADIPAYRGVSSLVLQQIYIGINYYMKDWKISCSRIYRRIYGTPQWYPETASPKILDINAVHVLRECLTDPEWGNNVPEDQIDQNSWESAALQCFNEGLGFSFLWDRNDDLNAFISEVLRHIQASVFLNRLTGKWEIKLYRQESLDEVLIISPETIINLDLAKRNLSELTSEVTVRYVDNLTDKSDSVTVKNSALIARYGTVVSKEITYSGVSKVEVAKQLADRDLYQLGLPLYHGSIEVSRTFEYLNRGSIFILDYPEIFGEYPIVCRIASINIGTVEKEAIKISFYEDCYSYNIHRPSVEESPLYYETTSWAAPDNTALPVTIRKYLEVPYYFVARLEGDATAQGTPTYQTGYLVAGQSPSDTAIDAAISVNSSVVGTLDFCYTAQLTSAIDRQETLIILDSPIDLELLSAGTVAQIGEELVYILSVNFPEVSIRRGILDTIPETHPIGTRFFALQNYNGVDNTIYAVGETVSVKLLTNTSDEQLPEASAPLDTITLTGRMHKPYRPANLKINGLYWNPLRHKKVVLEYASRNRFLETTGSPIGFYEGSITSEPAITYTAEIYDGETLVKTHTTSALSMEITVPDTITAGRLELFSTNAFGNSERIIHTFTSMEITPTMDSETSTFDSTYYTMDMN